MLAPIEDVAGLPRVLLIGDSISMGYTLPVRELLKGNANVHRPPENCGDTNRGLAKLDLWLGDKRWDAIHFNFGLHDLKYLDEKGTLVTPDKGKQVNPLPQYENSQVGRAFERNRGQGHLVFDDAGAQQVGRPIKDSEIEYNAVAAKVAAEFGIAIDNLHAVAKANQATIQLPHNVHFTRGTHVLAKAVATSIEKSLEK